jgi:hypothetical protein
MTRPDARGAIILAHPWISRQAMEKRIADALAESEKVLMSVKAGGMSVREVNMHLKESRDVLLRIKKELDAKRPKG